MRWYKKWFLKNKKILFWYISEWKLNTLKNNYNYTPKQGETRDLINIKGVCLVHIPTSNSTWKKWYNISHKYEKKWLLDIIVGWFVIYIYITNKKQYTR
jgi:hypothetical protein